MVHPGRQRFFGSDASSLRDTESETTWLGRISGGASNDGAADGEAGRAAGESAGGAATGAAGGAAGGVAAGADNAAASGAAGVAGDLPPPGSGPPSDHGNHSNNPRISRRQQRIQTSSLQS